MTERPFTYVCSPFRGDVEKNTRLAREYSRRVFDAGYCPIAPHLLFPQFLDDADPSHRQAGIEMGLALLMQCQMLVVCGEKITDGMAEEIQRAAELDIPAIALERLPGRDATPQCGFRGDPGQLSVFVSNPNQRDPMGYLDALIPLPANRNHIEKAMEIIRIKDPAKEEYFFHSPNGGDGRLQDYLPHPIQRNALDEVNYFAARLEALVPAERARLAACLEVGLDTGSIKDLHNLLHKLAGECPQKRYNGPRDVPREYRVFTETAEKSARRSLLGQIDRPAAQPGSPEKPAAPPRGPER